MLRGHSFCYLSNPKESFIRPLPLQPIPLHRHPNIYFVLTGTHPLTNSTHFHVLLSNMTTELKTYINFKQYFNKNLRRISTFSLNFKVCIFPKSCNYVFLFLFYKFWYNSFIPSTLTDWFFIS